MGSRSHKFLSLVEELLTINAVVGDVSVSSGIWPLKGCSCSCKGPYILVALCGLIVLKKCVKLRKESGGENMGGAGVPIL